MDSQRHDAERRARSEADFHDSRIRVDHEDRLGYAYASVADVYRFAGVPEAFMDKSVLEVGCFRGDQASGLHHFTGQYHGIDISPAAVDHCRALGLPSGFEFDVDDANRLDTIAEGSVDYAFGNGVLHHLELQRFAPALQRKLATDGIARFVEPAQGNLALRAFRTVTPHLRTPDEYPFDGAAIELLERHFDVRIAYQALARPFLPMLFFNAAPSIRLARWLDDRLLRNRFLQSQAWLLQIELGKR